MNHGTLTGYKDGCRCEPCREVRREYVRVRRLAKGEEIRAADRDYYQRTRADRLAYQRQWRTENRDKRNAQLKVQRAVKSGRLVRPDQCEECGASAYVDGHHEDYAKPLDVRWLCHRCHRLAHIDRDTWARWDAGALTWEQLEHAPLGR